jgi:hypothetical protein
MRPQFGGWFGDSAQPETLHQVWEHPGEQGLRQRHLPDTAQPGDLGQATLQAGPPRNGFEAAQARPARATRIRLRWSGHIIPFRQRRESALNTHSLEYS